MPSDLRLVTTRCRGGKKEQTHQQVSLIRNRFGMLPHLLRCLLRRLIRCTLIYLAVRDRKDVGWTIDQKANDLAERCRLIGVLR